MLNTSMNSRVVVALTVINIFMLSVFLFGGGGNTTSKPTNVDQDQPNFQTPPQESTTGSPPIAKPNPPTPQSTFIAAPPAATVASPNSAPASSVLTTTIILAAFGANNKTLFIIQRTKQDGVLIAKELGSGMTAALKEYQTNSVSMDLPQAEIKIIQNPNTNPNPIKRNDDVAVVLMWDPATYAFDHVKNLMGSIVRMSRGSQLIVVPTQNGMTEDQRAEIGLWINGSVIEYSSARAQVINQLLPTVNANGIAADFGLMATSLPRTFKNNEAAPKCWIEMKWETPRILPFKTNNRFCFAVTTYSYKSGGGFVEKAEDLALFNAVLVSLIQTHSQSKLDFEFFVSTQVDSFWDDPVRVKSFTDLWDKTTKEANMTIPLRLFRYPLAHGLTDITWKWNKVPNEAYLSGCEYIYQYSDDTRMLTKLSLDYLVERLKAQNNFGIAGLYDITLDRVMTLSMAHRTHFEIMGSYWPIQLRNWWADNWAQMIYGQDYLILNKTHHKMENLDSQGKRYAPCWNTAEFLWVYSYEADLKIRDWLEAHPTPGIRTQFFRDRALPIHHKNSWKRSTALNDSIEDNSVHDDNDDEDADK